MQLPADDFGSIVLVVEEAEVKGISKHGYARMPLVFLLAPRNAAKPAAAPLAWAAAVEAVVRMSAKDQVFAAVVQAVMVLVVGHKAVGGRRSAKELMKTRLASANPEASITSVRMDLDRYSPAMLLNPGKVRSVDQNLEAFAGFRFGENDGRFAASLAIVKAVSLLECVFPASGIDAAKLGVSAGKKLDSALSQAPKNALVGGAELLGNGRARPARLIEGDDLIGVKFAVAARKFVLLRSPSQKN